MSDPAVPPVPPVPPVPAAPYTYPGGSARPVDLPPAPETAGRTSTPGVVALVAAVAAAVAAPVTASLAGFRIGMGAGSEIASRPLDADVDWSILSPVREWVLLGEIAFWIGTALGIWAIVQGIVAAITDRGRPQGIIAAVVAALGPVAFAVAVWLTIAMGYAAGSSIGG